MIGGGVIGRELAFMFAGFGTVATTLDTSERPGGCKESVRRASAGRRRRWTAAVHPRREPSCGGDPPGIVVGPSWADLQDDEDIIWAEIELDTPRSATDEHGDGLLAVAARRSTGCIVAANGIGARFDEIVHAIVVAVDGEVPVRRLAPTIQPFPTVGEVLAQVFDLLLDQLDG